MLRPAKPIFGLVTDLARPLKLLIAENALLRQQLEVLERQIKRPKLRWFDRAVMVVTSSITATWRATVLIVKPETILRWHREGFRLFWRWKTRTPRPQNRITPEVVDLSSTDG
jgi:hypothetical protein